MKDKWTSPKTIIGSVATGEYYYPRTQIVDEIWAEIEKGNYILIAAPRRVGKTSIMRDMEKNPRSGYLVKFESVEAVKSENEFYEKLYKLILTCINGSLKSKTKIKDFFKRINIEEIEILTGNIKLKNNNQNYLEAINTIFKELDENIETILLLLDELPEVLHNLHKEGKTEDAKAILNQLRTWRQSNFTKLQFVLAGSVGIHYVAKIIVGRTTGLNDLNTIVCKPFIKESAKEFIEWATLNASIQYDKELTNYLLQKIQHYYTPYFINLMLDEIDKQARATANKSISKIDIDNAFDKVIINNKNFADWKNRLSVYLPKDEFLFLNEILTHIAHKGSISIQGIYDKADKHNKLIEYMDLINELENDGYIVETEFGSQKYIFISPFLKEYWKRNNPIYNG